MLIEPFKALALALGLTVAYADEQQNGRGVHHCKRFRIVFFYNARVYEPLEYAGMVINEPVDIPAGVHFRKLGAAKLLDREHFAQAAYSLVMQRIQEYLPHLFAQRILCYAEKNAPVELGVSDMNGKRARKAVIPLSGFVYDSGKYRLLAREVVVQRRSLYAYRLSYLPDADGVVAICGKNPPLSRGGFISAF